MSLHEDAIVIDLHADTMIPMRTVGYRIDRQHHNPFLQKLGFYHCDLPRFRAGGMNAQFFSMVTSPYPQRGCAHSCLRQIERLKQESIPISWTGNDIRQAHRSGTFTALIGIEGGHNLEGNIENLQRFRDAGVRYLGLAHFTANDICTPCGGIGSDANAPLTDFGREVLSEMNRRDMIIDLAHVARQASLDAAKASTQPVIVSHAGIRRAHSLWRNLDDQQIRAVADTDGAIGIIFAWRYLGKHKRGVEMLAPHFEHVRKLVGARHLALGSDFDGAIEPVRGLEDVSRLPAVTDLLLDLGWKEKEIRGVLGENVLRVLDATSSRDDRA